MAVKCNFLDNRRIGAGVAREQRGGVSPYHAPRARLAVKVRQGRIQPFISSPPPSGKLPLRPGTPCSNLLAAGAVFRLSSPPSPVRRRMRAALTLSALARAVGASLGRATLGSC